MNGIDYPTTLKKLHSKLPNLSIDDLLLILDSITLESSTFYSPAHLKKDFSNITYADLNYKPDDIMCTFNEINK